MSWVYCKVFCGVMGEARELEVKQFDCLNAYVQRYTYTYEESNLMMTIRLTDSWIDHAFAFVDVISSHCKEKKALILRNINILI